MRDSPFPSPLKLCFRYEYEYESHLPLIRSPRATIPSISIKMGRCLGSIMRARHFSRFPSSSSRPRAEEGVEGGGKKNRASVWKKKKEGKEAKRVKRSLLGASLRSARFFSPSFRLANRFENSGRNLGNFATEITPAEISERASQLGRFVRPGFVLNFYNERRFFFSFSSHSYVHIFDGFLGFVFSDWSEFISLFVELLLSFNF